MVLPVINFAQRIHVLPMATRIYPTQMSIHLLRPNYENWKRSRRQLNASTAKQYLMIFQKKSQSYSGLRNLHFNIIMAVITQTTKGNQLLRKFSKAFLNTFLALSSPGKSF